jgi:hypothetical protein
MGDGARADVEDDLAGELKLTSKHPSVPGRYGNDEKAS